MKLSMYLESNKIGVQEFGNLIGCHKSQVSRIVNGLRTPTLEQAVAIEKATDGLVTPNDFLPSPDHAGSAAE